MGTQVSVIQNDNEVSVGSVYNQIRVVDNNREGNIVQVQQPVTNIINVYSGPRGIQGPPGSGSLVSSSYSHTSSYSAYAVTSSYSLTSSFALNAPTLGLNELGFGNPSTGAITSSNSLKFTESTKEFKVGEGTPFTTGGYINIADNVNSNLSAFITNTSVGNGAVGSIGIGQSLTARLTLAHFNSGFFGNIPGTSIVYSGSNLIFANDTTSGNLITQASQRIELIGVTGSNYGTRLDAVGFRIGQLSTLHTANTVPFKVVGNTEITGSLNITGSLSTKNYYTFSTDSTYGWSAVIGSSYAYLYPAGVDLYNGTWGANIYLRVGGSNFGNTLGNGALEISTNSTTGFVLGTTSNTSLVLGTNNTERVRITNSGSLLMGHTGSASGSIDIRRTNTGSAIYVANNSNALGGNAPLVVSDGALTYGFGWDLNSQYQYRVDSNGLHINAINNGPYKRINIEGSFTNITTKLRVGDSTYISAIPSASLEVVGQVQITTLAGTGSRMVEVDPTGIQSAGSAIIDGRINNVTDIALIVSGSNWTGVDYTGASLTNIYAGQTYHDSTYFYYAPTDNTIIRLARA